jgi:diguanylate cyclase (GGDEF)-like protein
MNFQLCPSTLILITVILTFLVGSSLAAFGYVQDRYYGFYSFALSAFMLSTAFILYSFRESSSLLVIITNMLFFGACTLIYYGIHRLHQKGFSPWASTLLLAFTVVAILIFTIFFESKEMRIIAGSAYISYITFACALLIFRQGRIKKDPLPLSIILSGSFVFIGSMFAARSILHITGDVQESLLKEDNIYILINLSVIIQLFISAIGLILVAVFRLWKELEQAASTDSLTGLFNRRGFYGALENILALEARKKRNYAVAVVDIDYFKAVNDYYGHEGGDRVLVDLARCLKEKSRSQDIIARFGGEEFIIFGYEETPSTLANLAERLRSSVLDMEVVYRDERIRFTLSIGIASSMETDPPEIDSVIARADERLYMAKRGGRNRVVFMDEEEDPQTGKSPQLVPIPS